MTKTLVQIKKQITALEKEAEKVRAKEVAGVIQKINTAIEFYGLTAQDLFTKGSAAKPAKKSKNSPAAAKYQNKATGKTWSGHGRRPDWFVKAIEGGAKAEDLAI